MQVGDISFTRSKDQLDVNGWISLYDFSQLRKGHVTDKLTATKGTFEWLINQSQELRNLLVDIKKVQFNIFFDDAGNAAILLYHESGQEKVWDAGSLL